MDRPTLRRGAAAGTSRAPLLLRQVVSIAVLGLGAACAASRPLTPASLAGSRRPVSVTYPTPQTLHARATGRDSLLHGVTTVVGWPTAVRGDTLELQLDRWRADGRMHEMRPPDFTLDVLPDARATIRNRDQGGGGAILVTLLTMVAIAFGIAMIDIS